MAIDSCDSSRIKSDQGQVLDQEMIRQIADELGQSGEVCTWKLLSKVH